MGWVVHVDVHGEWVDAYLACCPHHLIACVIMPKAPIVNDKVAVSFKTIVSWGKKWSDAKFPGCFVNHDKIVECQQ